MKAHSTTKPTRLTHYRNPLKGQVKYMIEPVTTTDPETSEEQQGWDYLYAEFNGSDKLSIQGAIIRSFYSADEVEELTCAFRRGLRILEYMQYENIRNIAERVANGKSLKTDFTDLLQSKIYEIKLPLNTVMSGGTYEDLADYALKAKLNFYSDIENGYAYVYVRFILPQHATMLEPDENVTIIEHPGMPAKITT